MGMLRPAFIAGVLLSTIAPAALAAITRYEFHAVDPVIEVASGDAFVGDLLRSSATDANLHGTFVYDNEQLYPIVEFSGSAWGVSFDFSNIGLQLRSASGSWAPRDWVTVGPIHADMVATPPSTLGEHRLMLTGLQFVNDPPWVSGVLASSGGALPPDLSLLVGTTGLLEMCFDGAGNYYTCLFIHGVEVTEVPLPAGGALMLSALAGLVAQRRYRRR